MCTAQAKGWSPEHTELERGRKEGENLQGKWADFPRGSLGANRCLKRCQCLQHCKLGQDISLTIRLAKGQRLGIPSMTKNLEVPVSYWARWSSAAVLESFSKTR